MSFEIRDAVRRAVDGDRDALERVVRHLRDPIYGLSLRMLGNIEDAEDATQDVLIRVMTRLSTYRGDSTLTTWAYRIAANVLTDLLRTRTRRLRFADLDADLGQPSSPPQPDAQVLAREVYLGCALGLLACLDVDQRLAFVLAEVLGLDHNAGAEVVGVSPMAFRKRASRARSNLREFLTPRCSIVSPGAPCRCVDQVPLNIARGRVKPGALRLTTHPCSDASRLLIDPEVRRRAREYAHAIGRVIDVTELMRHQPRYTASARLRGLVDELVASGRPSA